MEMDLSPETANDSRNDRSSLIQSKALPKKELDVIKKPKGYWEDLSGWGFKPISKGKVKPIRAAL